MGNICAVVRSIQRIARETHPVGGDSSKSLSRHPGRPGFQSIHRGLRWWVGTDGCPGPPEATECNVASYEGLCRTQDTIEWRHGPATEILFFSGHSIKETSALSTSNPIYYRQQ